VTCRVLLADAKGRKLLVTLKKSMVKEIATPVTTYEQATRGTTATGFVTKVSMIYFSVWRTSSIRCYRSCVLIHTLILSCNTSFAFCCFCHDGVVHVTGWCIWYSSNIL
jgi:hypothetical protein